MSDSAGPIHDDPLLQVLWQAPVPATLQDEHFRIVDANAAFVSFCGRSREALIGIDPIELQPTEDRAANLAQREALPVLSESAPEVLGLRRRLLDAQGGERWYSIDARVYRAPGGRILWLAVLHDVTSERQALDESRRAQDELATWFELCPSGMLVFDDGGAVIRTNAAFEELTGRVLMSLDQADVELRWLLGRDTATRVRPQPPGLERESTLVLPDGRRRRIFARVRQLPGGDRQRRMMAVLEDRTAEEERDLARAEIDVLMDTASVGVATFDPQQGWLAPQAGARGSRSGGPGGGALHGIGRDLVEPASLPEYERLQTALRRRERVEVRYAVNHPSSGRRWLLTRVEPAVDARGTLSVVTLDVTEQELARQHNEQLLRELSTILDGSAAGIAYLRGDVLVRCNRRFERMLGFAAGEAAGATLREAFGRRFDAQSLLAAVDASLAAGQRHESEWLLAEGRAERAVWVSLSVRAAPGADGAAAVATGTREAVAVLTDISRLKAQQRELEDALRERETMFSLSEVGIAYMRGPRIERANPAMAQLTGYSAPELSTLDGSELYTDARACVEFEASVAGALRAEGRFSGERRLRRRDGRLVWVQVTVRPVDEADETQGVIASFVDVDERHHARDTLLHQAERTRAILDSVLVGIVTVSSRGIEWMNRSARRMFGGELADFVGESIAVVATPEADHPLRRSSLYLRRLVEGQAETFECRLQARDGRQFWVVGSVVITGQPSRDGVDEGDRQLTFALLDIERRRQAETSIAQAQASLQRVIETAPLAIALFDARSLRVLQANQRASAFFGCAIEEVLGQDPEQGLPPARARQLRDWLEAAALSPAVLHREWRDAMADAVGPGTSTRPATVWDVRIVALAASDASAAQMLLVASDVTEQRAADHARLQAAIQQREVLVREVHHRIKNNLQGVAGLLQQNAGRHPEVAQILGEAVSQVQAIAQVYGLQVGTDGPLRAARVVETIAGSVQRTFGRSIEVEATGAVVQRVELPEAEAIPIALTLNELLTNAVKHGGGPAVRCRVQAVEEGVLITIANRGRLRAGFDLAQVPGGVSGLGLVRALLPRRSARLSLEQQGDEVVAFVTLQPPSVRIE